MLNSLLSAPRKKGVLIVMSLLSVLMGNSQAPLWQSPVFSLYADSVIQQSYTAKAVSRTEISSNYQGPANEFKTSIISFKFSINGKDNEMVSGMDHHFNIDTEDLDGSTPLIRFGQQMKLKNRQGWVPEAWYYIETAVGHAACTPGIQIKRILHGV